MWGVYFKILPYKWVTTVRQYFTSVEWKNMYFSFARIV